ncbi:hypothetical protein WK68_20425 [Burkholderia ubonensis]|nr:hypothetical protein WK68_20425 [Burkholderia ubonensis]
MARHGDSLRKHLVTLSEERDTIEQACEEQRARVREVDEAIGREQSRTEALTRSGEPFSIDVLMQANRCIDSLVHERMVLAAKLDRLIEELSTKDEEMGRVRREAAMSQLRDTIYEERTEVIRNEVSVHHERRADEEAEEMALIRRLGAGRFDE